MARLRLHSHFLQLTPWKHNAGVTISHLHINSRQPQPPSFALPLEQVRPPLRHIPPLPLVLRLDVRRQAGRVVQHVLPVPLRQLEYLDAHNIAPLASRLLYCLTMYIVFLVLASIITLHILLNRSDRRRAARQLRPVLQALSDKSEANSFEVTQHLRQAAPNLLAKGDYHSILHLYRLEQLRLVRARWIPVAKRHRRVYTLTDAGRRALVMP